MSRPWPRCHHAFAFCMRFTCNLLLSLSLYNFSYLHLRFDLGSGEMNLGYNVTKINDGLWHRIRASRYVQCQMQYFLYTTESFSLIYYLRIVCAPISPETFLIFKLSIFFPHTLPHGLQGFTTRYT